MAKEYLGDSVYVDTDFDGLVLTTENGEEPTNKIYLEFAVIEALLKYIEKQKLLRRDDGQ